MKRNSILSMVFSLAVSAAVAQLPSLDNVYLIPQNPNDTTQINVVVECTLQNLGGPIDFTHDTSNNSVHAVVHYCIGLLTAIDVRSDTFSLGSLQAGSYDLDLDFYSANFDGVSCDNFSKNDSRSLQFVVTPTVPVSIKEPLTYDEDAGISVYPNPNITNLINIDFLRKSDYQNKVYLCNALGEVKSIIDVSDVRNPIQVPSEKGVYFLIFEQKSGAKKVVKYFQL